MACRSKFFACALALALVGCAASPAKKHGDDYLRYVGATSLLGEDMALRFLDHQMPLQVHLPTPGAADIRVAWADRPDGDRYIAYCAFDSNLIKRMHGVERILATARWPNGYVADLQDVYATLLHEMGHAIGFSGHSPNPGDIMSDSIRGDGKALSERDLNTLARLYALGNGTRIPGGKRSRRS